MANDVPENPSPFDVRTIRHLVALMSRHDLSEIDLREGQMRIRLRRGGHVPTVPMPSPTVALAPPASPSVKDGATASATTPPAPARMLVPIKSPTPGTFYAASGPGAEPFVKVGSRVTPSSVVCVIEAMKIFNEITADCTGVITEILVDNQQPVEYGQVLFQVDPSA